MQYAGFNTPTKKLVRKGPWAREALQVIFDLSHWTPQVNFAKNFDAFLDMLYGLAEGMHGRVGLVSQTRVIFLVFPENAIDFLETVWNRWQPKQDLSDPEAIKSLPTLRILVDQATLNHAALGRVYRDFATMQPDALENIIFLTASAREKLSKKSLIPSYSRVLPKLTKLLPAAYIPSASPIANSPLVAHATSAENGGRYLAETEKEFFGRSLEVESLRTYLKSGKVVVISAPGGTGKTRLALEVINQVKDRFKQGSATVDLTATTDGDSIPNILLASLGLTARVSMTSLESAIYALRGSDMLIFFDNCEQVQESVSFIIDQLHKACPNLCLTATTRIPLNVKGESEIRLDPLPVPPVGAVLDSNTFEIYPAAKLLDEKLRVYKPLFRVNSWNWNDFAAVCRQTEGNPLAIEIAASKIRHSHLRYLAFEATDGLEATSDQDSTSSEAPSTPVEDAFTYALDSLDPNARDALEDLAVLGSFFNEDIIRVPLMAHGIQKARVPRILSRWRNRALIAEIEVDGLIFYRLSTPLREYILAGLTEEEITASRDSQAEAIVKTVMSWREWWDDTPQADDYYRKWEPVLPLLEGALRSCIAAESRNANRVAMKIMPFYLRRGRYQEGLAIAKSLIAMHNHRKHPRQRVYPVLISINLLLTVGDLKLLRKFIDRAIALSKQVDLSDYALIVYNLLEPMIRVGWLDEAQRVSDEYLEKVASHKSIEGAGILTMIGHLNVELGRLDAAKAFFTQARILNARSGSAVNLCEIDSGLAFIAIQESRFEEAIDTALLGFKRAISIGNQDLFSVSVLSIAIASYRQGRKEEAGYALSYFEKILARTRGIIYPIFRERYRSIRVEIVTSLGQEGYAQICALNLSSEALIKKLQARKADSK